VDAEQTVLGIIHAYGGPLEGRTYLQKVTYFVSRLLRLRAGFEPHYYGPHSRVVSSKVDSAVSNGILTEARDSFGGRRSPGQFEHVRYRYELSRMGRAYVRGLERLDEQGFRKVAEIVQRIRGTGVDYRQLSCAAKVDYLLTATGGRITRRRAKEEAKKVGWHLSDRDIETAVDILEKLGIAKRS
jgi:uncharacterized protein YwgA